MQSAPGVLEVTRGALPVAQHLVLGAQVEGCERARRLLRLAHEQLEVAARLVPADDAALEVSVVLDAHGRRLEALRQERRHEARLLLVDAALEAVLRAVAEEPHGRMRD